MPGTNAVRVCCSGLSPELLQDPAATEPKRTPRQPLSVGPSAASAEPEQAAEESAAADHNDAESSGARLATAHGRAEQSDRGGKALPRAPRCSSTAAAGDPPQDAAREQNNGVAPDVEDDAHDRRKCKSRCGCAGEAWN